MKILMIGYNIAEKEKEAINKCVWTLAEELIKHNNRIVLISLDKVDETKNLNGIRIYKVKSTFNIIKKLSKILNKENPDIIHDHFGMVGSSIITLLFSKNTNIKKIKTVYSCPFTLNKCYLKKLKMEDYLMHFLPTLFLDNTFIRRRTLERFDKIIYINKNLNDQLISKSVNLQPTIPTLKIPNEKVIRDFRYLNNIKSSDKIILYLGHPSSRKGIFEIIKATNKSEENIKFLFSFSNKGIYKKKILDMLHNKKNVRVINNVNLEVVYASSDIFLLPLTMPFATTSPPLTILESLKLKTPVITTNNKYLNNIVLHKKNGFLLNELSNNSILNAINFVLNKKIKKNIIESKYLKEINLKKTIEEIIKIYNN